MVEFLTDLVQTGTAMQDLVAEILKEKIVEFENNETEVNRMEFCKIRKEVQRVQSDLNGKIVEGSEFEKINCPTDFFPSVIFFYSLYGLIGNPS